MKRWLPFVVPFVVVLAAGIGAKIIVSGAWAPRCDAYEEVGFADLTHDQPCVRLTGLAHYPVVVRQTMPGGLLRTEQTLYLFPLFEPGSTEDRAVEVLVRTPRKPEELVSYEGLTIEGRIERVTPEKVPYSTEIELGKRSNYFFTDHMVVIEPTAIETEDGRWTPDEP